MSHFKMLGGPLQLYLFPILSFTETSTGINLNWIAKEGLKICFRFVPLLDIRLPVSFQFLT